jgi:hypothetical protein
MQKEISKWPIAIAWEFDIRCGASDPPLDGVVIGY